MRSQRQQRKNARQLVVRSARRLSVLLEHGPMTPRVSFEEAPIVAKATGVNFVDLQGDGEYTERTTMNRSSGDRKELTVLRQQPSTKDVEWFARRCAEARAA